jgi:hypothetical protein
MASFAILFSEIGDGMVFFLYKGNFINLSQLHQDDTIGVRLSLAFA